MNINHLSEVGETYFEHLYRALKVSFTLLFTALVCFVHSILPFLFTTFVSNKIKQMNKDFNILVKQDI
jgi:hypothetical protein